MDVEERKGAASVEFKAFNFAEDSTNKIHDDKVARQYGFSGGLVPGIAVFAYMSHPVVAKWARGWFDRGFIRATFIKPIYAGERVRVKSEAVGEGGDELEIQVTNHDGLLCAVGLARLSGGARNAPLSADYPKRELPPAELRLTPSVEHLGPAGTLGSVTFCETGADAENRARQDYLDNLDIYSGPGAPYHPAYLLAQANQILMRNVDLGPWIHVKSELDTFAVPKAGEKLDIRGRIVRSFQKKGHDMVDLDLAVFDAGNHAVAAIKHTAIVRLRQAEGE
ncbi:MAG: MaoC family dehydratase [Deltaproteobacteria bacterium]|nr:MaoC family dehydratase [Deltaproteobacteria bacterium]